MKGKLSIEAKKINKITISFLGNVQVQIELKKFQQYIISYHKITLRLIFLISSQ